MALVSIITPLFNRAHLLTETWSSIRSQTYTHWEWIIVDDGSTDGSVALAHEISQQDNRVMLYLRPPQLTKGPSACRNYGAKMARGVYFIFLDSDDLLAPYCLEQRISTMLSDNHLDFAVFPMQCFRHIPGDNDVELSQFLETKEENLKLFLTDHPPWQTMCPIWKKNSFLSLGGFNEHYTCMEDPDLHIRAMLSDYSFKIVKTEPDCYYRQSFSENQEQNYFWRNSIEGRVIFLKDIYDYLNHKIENKGQKLLYITYLSQFYLSLIKGFMLARLQAYQKEFLNISNWAKERGIINSLQYMKIKLAYHIYTSNSKIITVLHLRGMVYRLL